MNGKKTSSGNTCTQSTINHFGFSILGNWYMRIASLNVTHTTYVSNLYMVSLKIQNLSGGELGKR